MSDFVCSVCGKSIKRPVDRDGITKKFFDAEGVKEVCSSCYWETLNKQRGQNSERVDLAKRRGGMKEEKW